MKELGATERMNIVNTIADTMRCMWEENEYCFFREKFSVWCKDGKIFPEKNKEDYIELATKVMKHVDAISELFSEFASAESEY